MTTEKQKMNIKKINYKGSVSVGNGSIEENKINFESDIQTLFEEFIFMHHSKGYKHLNIFIDSGVKINCLINLPSTDKVSKTLIQLRIDEIDSSSKLKKLLIKEWILNAQSIEKEVTPYFLLSIDFIENLIQTISILNSETISFQYEMQK